MLNQFEIDVRRIREDAREHMEDGAVTGDYGADVEAVIQVLQDVVATEIVCFMRYTQHSIVASGINRAPVAAEFTEHAAEEWQHCLRAAERISQLGGTPDFDPSQVMKRAHTEYSAHEATDLERMLKENLVAERIVISSYQEMVRWLGDRDPTTRRMLEEILAEEEEHADDINDLLGN